jgi:hypothetical protein
MVDSTRSFVVAITRGTRRLYLHPTGWFSSMVNATRYTRIGAERVAMHHYRAFVVDTVAQ